MIGRSLGHFEITAALGAGGMGEVYRATDTKLGREVALKVLPADLAADAGRLARFRREAQTLASLDHPGIVTIHSVEEADGGGAPVAVLTWDFWQAAFDGDIVTDANAANILGSKQQIESYYHGNGFPFA